MDKSGSWTRGGLASCILQYLPNEIKSNSFELAILGIQIDRGNIVDAEASL